MVYIGSCLVISDSCEMIKNAALTKSYAARCDIESPFSRQLSYCRLQFFLWRAYSLQIDLLVSFG